MSPEAATRPALRLAAPALVAAAGAAGAAAVALHDPHVAGSWGVCPFLLLTGRPCPFCGGLRAVDDLVHGEVTAALGSNALVVVAVPLVLGWLVVWSARLARGGADAPVPVPGRVTLVAAAVVVLAFGVLRWLPSLAFLAP